MADNQKYYYLRLKDDFFDREEIKVIEALPNGYMYSNILLKLYLKSLKRDGKLMVTDYIPYNLETLSAVLGHNIDTVRSAIDLFKNFKLLDVLDNGAIYLLDIQNFIGKSSTEADRKKLYRARIESEKKLLESDNCLDKCPNKKKEASNKAKVKNKKDKCPDNSPLEQEQEIEQEIEKEIEQQQYIEILKNDYSEKDIENLIKLFAKNNVAAAVVREKLFVIKSKRGIKNRVGALITAIRDNWELPVELKEEIDVMKFNNFEPREYDYDSLEKKLLGHEPVDADYIEDDCNMPNSLAAYLGVNWC